MCEPVYASEYQHHHSTPEELAANPTWMAFLSAPAQRLEAARVYMTTPVEHLGRKAAKRAKRAAVYDLPFVREAQGRRAREAAAEKERLRVEEAAQRAAGVQAARLPLSELLALALKHSECSRWRNDGNWTHKRWVLERIESGPFFRDFSQLYREANAEAYQAMVSILGRRSSNRGGGRREDVTRDTKTEATKLRLARDVIAGRNVSPARLMSIADLHARAWAVERCGGWEKLASHARVQQKTDEGTLLDGASIGLGNDLLLVRCPTTRRKYVLHVPRPVQLRFRTVARALQAVNGIASAKIVASS